MEDAIVLPAFRRLKRSAALGRGFFQPPQSKCISIKSRICNRLIKISKNNRIQTPHHVVSQVCEKERERPLFHQVFVMNYFINV